jgi:hypothetical protein
MAISSMKTGLIKRSLLVGNTAFNPTSYESIATVTVGSGGAADITFSSIPSTYTHLQIRGIGRSTYNGSVNEASFLYMQFNSDTGANYDAHRLIGDGSSASASASNNRNQMIPSWISTLNSTASVFYSSVTDILDYTNTNKYKTTRSLGGGDVNGSGAIVYYSNLWRSTSAISTIKLYPESNNFAQYTQFALYGIKS